MGEAFKFFAANSSAALIVALTICFLVICVATMYIVAFVQGRSITFWPPSIGERPVSKE
jgi:hypothetical protein